MRLRSGDPQSIRFGVDASYEHPQHIEDRNNIFYFTGAATILNGGPGANAYNSLADFVLGDFYEGQNWLQVLQPYLTMRTWEYAAYVRDQWHVSPKLTVNYGVRWEFYPVPTRDAVMNKPSSVAPSGLGTTGNGLYFTQHAECSLCRSAAPAAFRPIVASTFHTNYSRPVLGSPIGRRKNSSSAPDIRCRPIRSRWGSSKCRLIPARCNSTK